MKAFIGIFYLQVTFWTIIVYGTVKAPVVYLQHRCLWNALFLSRFIEFDDIHNCNDRLEFGKFILIRDFFKQVNKGSATHCVPSAYLAIDETLYPCRGRVGIRQYNPNKPAKYGLLYYSLCDSLVQYTYFTLSLSLSLSHILVNLIQQMALSLSIMLQVQIYTLSTFETKNVNTVSSKGAIFMWISVLLL